MVTTTVEGDRIENVFTLEIVPHAGEFGACGIVTCGAASTAMGQLLTVLGRYREAEDAFRSGMSDFDRIGSPFLLAVTLFSAARSMSRVPDPNVRAMAYGMVEDALGLAQQYGFAGVERRVDELKASLG